MPPMSSDILPELHSLRRQHHALLPPYLLQLPGAPRLAIPASQHFLIDHILDDPLIRDVQPERTYRRTFWRKIFDVLEHGVQQLQDDDTDNADEYEVDERFYQELAELMVANPASESSELPKQSYRTFLYDSPAWSGKQGERSITLLEEQIAIQSGTTGLRTWYGTVVHALRLANAQGALPFTDDEASSLHLAHHILRAPEILFHSFKSHATNDLPTIIELGAGTGLMSILLSQLGFDVTSTDVGRDKLDVRRQAPLELLSDNIVRNKLEKPPQVEALDWSDALRPSEDRSETWKQLGFNVKRTIIAADVIYDPDLIPPLVATILALLRTSLASIAVIAATVRNPCTMRTFVSTCLQEGLSITPLRLKPMDTDNPTFWDSALDRGCEVRMMRIVLAENG